MNTFNSGYTISRGSGNPQFVQSDLAVIKVDETNKPMSILRSACLPRPNNDASSALNAGWSEPPPLDYIEIFASGFTPFYRLLRFQSFIKVILYKM